ncbi:MAG TPA: EF-hand domain-containing protein [Kofleriaceae bacterium]|jgi:hypothetical protein
MFTKLKLILATSAALLGGAVTLAAAQPAPSAAVQPADRAQMRELRQEKRAEKRAAMKERFDSNRDGKLEPAERRAMRETLASERFAKLDKNGDGVITRDEFVQGAMHRHARGFGKRFRGGAPMGAPSAAPGAQFEE